MKTKYHHAPLLPLLVATLLATACSQTELEPTPAPITPGKLITLTATNGDALTRMTHTYDDGTNTIALGWTGTDAFKLYKGGLGTVYTIDNIDADPTKAEFTGTEPPAAHGATTYLALYPAHKASEFQTDAVMSLLGQQQEGNTSTSHLADYNLMVARGITDLGAPIVFKNQVAVLRIIVPQKAGYILQSLTMAVEKDEEIAVVKNLADDTDAQMGKSLTLTFSGTMDGEVTAYLAVFGSTLKAGNKLYFSTLFKEDVTTDPGTLHQTSTPITVGASGQSIQAGKVYNVGTLALADVDTTPANNDPRLFYTGITAVDFDGAGSADNPYLIQNAKQLKKLVDNVAGGTSYYYEYFKLATDIHVTADEWIPIGISDKPFRGFFDGGGHTISGALKASSVPGSYLGFFGNIFFGEIHNLHVAADITYTGETIRYIGGIAGSVSMGKLTNNTMSGAIIITHTSTTNSIIVGGIAGVASGEVSDCVFNGSINGGSTFSLYVGGIVGDLSNVAVSRCTNKADITITSGKTGYLGGIGGWIANVDASSVVKDCLNEGNLQFEGCSTMYCGGIVGVGKGPLTNNRNLGDITGIFTGANYGFIGGLIGWLNDSSGIVESSYNAGRVKVTVASNLTNTKVGSLVGDITAGEVKTCNTNSGTAEKNSVGQGLIGNGSTTTCETAH